MVIVSPPMTDGSPSLGRGEKGSRWRMEQERCVFTASGEIQAQQIRTFLEAAGIASELRGESLRKTHGLTVDGLGMVEIVVSSRDEARARELLASAEGGEFRLDDDAEVGEP
jgi:hypothetical protein